MIVSCPVSIGELIDKLSILKVKESFIKDEDKLNHVKKEILELEKILEGLDLKGQDEYLNRLIKINTTLWKIEDDIRDKEAQSEFDKDFIELARSVYLTNDKRFEVKNEINKKFGSHIVEVKSYKEYSKKA
jgi:hypothetical protein